MAEQTAYFSPQTIADRLQERYGEEALLRAALCAQKAVDAQDLPSCITWRDVIDILDLRQRALETHQ